MLAVVEPSIWTAQVIIPAATLLVTGVVSFLVKFIGNRLEKKLDWNTTITATAQADQTRGFKDIGTWRKDIDIQMAVFKEKIDHLEHQQIVTHQRVERIPTFSQVGYKRTHKPEPEDP